MSLSVEAGMLKQIPMFRDVELSKLKLMALAGERLTYAPGETMFLEGDMPDAVYVILRGAVEVLRNSPVGEVRLAQLEAGALVGELSVICGSCRSATIAAVSDVCALKIEKTIFLDLMAQTPQLVMAVNRELAHRLEAMLEIFSKNQAGGKA